MLLVIVIVAMMGGLLTAALAFPLGLAIALMAAPLGASMSAVLGLSYLALRASYNHKTRAQAPSAGAYKPHEASAKSDPLSPA